MTYYAMIWTYGEGAYMNDAPVGTVVGFTGKTARDNFVARGPDYFTAPGARTAVRAAWVRRWGLNVSTSAEYELYR